MAAGPYGTQDEASIQPVGHRAALWGGWAQLPRRHRIRSVIANRSSAWWVHLLRARRVWSVAFAWCCSGWMLCCSCEYPPYTNRKALDRKSFPVHDAQVPPHWGSSVRVCCGRFMYSAPAKLQIPQQQQQQHCLLLVPRLLKQRLPTPQMYWLLTKLKQQSRQPSQVVTKWWLLVRSSWQLCDPCRPWAPNESSEWSDLYGRWTAFWKPFKSNQAKQFRIAWSETRAFSELKREIVSWIGLKGKKVSIFLQLIN